MGISSNQARFLAITARQIDLEFRTQQICQRRLRLSSELENVATEYNNHISNRQMYTFNTSNGGVAALSIANIQAMQDTNGNNYKVLAASTTAGAFVSITDANISTLATTGTVTPTGGAAITLTQLGLSTGASTQEVIDAALRNGILTMSKVVDQYTQQAVNVDAAGTNNYELKDWRTIPQLADELYNADDVNVENWYDNIVTDINAQDKKLQLEQASLEVEYKAVSSEKEAVKKILDTNAQSSFKYFS